MLSKILTKVLDQVEFHSRSDRNKRLAELELLDRLKSEANSNACLRCEAAGFGVQWQAESSGLKDWTLRLHVCKNDVLTSGEGEILPPSLPFFCTLQEGSDEL